MFFELFLGSGGDLFSNVSPVSKSSGFGGFYKKKFLVGAPVGMYDGQGTLLDDTVWMSGMFCGVLRKAYSQHPSLSWGFYIAHTSHTLGIVGLHSVCGSC